MSEVDEATLKDEISNQMFSDEYVEELLYLEADRHEAEALFNRLVATLTSEIKQKLYKGQGRPTFRVEGEDVSIYNDGEFICSLGIEYLSVVEASCEAIANECTEATCAKNMG